MNAQESRLRIPGPQCSGAAWPSLGPDGLTGQGVRQISGGPVKHAATRQKKSCQLECRSTGCVQLVLVRPRAMEDFEMNRHTV